VAWSVTLSLLFEESVFGFQGETFKYG